MTAAEVLKEVMSAVDAHRWDRLTDHLHHDFSCAYLHTGETFDRTSWIRLNAEYPGFERLRVQEIVGEDGRAACWSLVTARGEAGTERFACATFVRSVDGLIIEMTEVWTEITQTVPEQRRPSR